MYTQCHLHCVHVLVHCNVEMFSKSCIMYSRCKQSFRRIMGELYIRLLLLDC